MRAREAASDHRGLAEPERDTQVWEILWGENRQDWSMAGEW